MSRITKKLVPSLSDLDGSILLINAKDPQLNTIKYFIEALEGLPYFIVLNKVDAVSVTHAQDIIDKLPKDIPVLLTSVLEHRGYNSIKKEMAKLPKGKIAILGIFNSGKTSFINSLTGEQSEVSPIPGTTLVVTPHEYMGWTLLDTIGDIWDVNRPLMFSIDLTGCNSLEEKIERCLNEEIDGLQSTVKDAIKPIQEAIKIIKESISEGNKLVITGAGASALVAQEMAGQAQETGTPVLVFTNEFATNAPLSFAKGFGEDDMAMSRYAARAVNKGDVCIGISASGGTAFVHEFLGLSRLKGAKTIAITENADTPLGHYADVIIKSNAKPEGASSSKIQIAHLAIGHTLMITLADERGLDAETCINFMLPEKVLNKKMGIK